VKKSVPVTSVLRAGTPRPRPPPAPKATGNSRLRFDLEYGSVACPFGCKASRRYPVKIPGGIRYQRSHGIFPVVGSQKTIDRCFLPDAIHLAQPEYSSATRVLQVGASLNSTVRGRAIKMALAIGQQASIETLSVATAFELVQRNFPSSPSWYAPVQKQFRSRTRNLALHRWSCRKDFPRCPESKCSGRDSPPK
jgi:hypothetical protein